MSWNAPTGQRAGSGPSLVEGDYVLTAADFRQVAAMLHADAGIHLPETKATLVYSRLAKRLRILGLESFREYCELVAGSDGLDERQKMLAALTTNVTRFFREPHHFEHLKTEVLPPLLQAARRGDRVRLWSAACSSGQEPYSIALTILELMPDAADFDVRILATDIDPNMVAATRQGVYSERNLGDVPAVHRGRWFERVSDDRSGEPQHQVAAPLRRLVSARELNLIGAWPLKARYQAIFCRNVVIYFEEETQSRVWSRFLPALAPGGRLYIGHSERLTGEAASCFTSDGVTTYRLNGSAR